MESDIVKENDDAFKRFREENVKWFRENTEGPADCKRMETMWCSSGSVGDGNRGDFGEECVRRVLEMGQPQQQPHVPDRWLNPVCDAIFWHKDPDGESPPVFWLEGVESISMLSKLLTIVGSHGGRVFGGFIRDFFRPLCVMQAAATSLHEPLDGCYDVWSILASYIVRPQTLCFKDLDLWFTTKVAYLRFVESVRQLGWKMRPMGHKEGQEEEEEEEGASPCVASHALTETPIYDNFKSAAHSEDRLASSRRLDEWKNNTYPMLCDRWWLLWPFVESGFEDPCVHRRTKKYYLRLDCVISTELPVNNYSINLLYYMPATLSWATGQPFSFAPLRPARNSCEEFSMETILEHVDCRKAIILPDYSAIMCHPQFISESTREAQRLLSHAVTMCTAAKSAEIGKTPSEYTTWFKNRLGFPNNTYRTWFNIVRDKHMRMLQSNFDLIGAIFHPPVNKQRTNISTATTCKRKSSS